jgi:hypothetical protein
MALGSNNCGSTVAITNGITGSMLYLKDMGFAFNARTVAHHSDAD